MLLPDNPRMVIPENKGDVIMLTANRRYWTDPEYRANVLEFMRYFIDLEQEVDEFLANREG